MISYNHRQPNPQQTRLGLEKMADGTAGYPITSDDVVKLLRQHGVVAEYDRPLEERSTVTHKAADVWLPVLEIMRDLSISVLGAVIVTLVVSPKSRVHAKVGRRHSEDEDTEWLEISGERDEVVEAIGMFLQADSDDEHE